jgi:hypothetical protein
MQCPTCGNKKISENQETWKTSECLCYEQSNLRDKYSLSNIPNTFWYKSIDSVHNTSVESFISKYTTSFDNIKSKGTGLYLYSTIDSITPSFVGTIILKEILKKGYTGRYISYDNFLEDMSKDILIRDDLILIDLINTFDVDRIDNNNYYKLLNMLNYRKNPIIFTSQESIKPSEQGKIERWKKVINFYVRTKAKQVELPDLSINFSIDATNLNDIFEEKSSCLTKIK